MNELKDWLNEFIEFNDKKIDNMQGHPNLNFFVGQSLFAKKVLDKIENLNPSVPQPPPEFFATEDDEGEVDYLNRKAGWSVPMGLDDTLSEYDDLRGLDPDEDMIGSDDFDPE